MNNEEKVKYLESVYNEETNKYDIPCECGLMRHLGIKKIFVINMHELRCNICNSKILPYHRE